MASRTHCDGRLVNSIDVYLANFVDTIDADHWQTAFYKSFGHVSNDIMLLVGLYSPNLGANLANWPVELPVDKPRVYGINKLRV